MDDGNKNAYLSYLYSWNVERRPQELRAYADSLTSFLGQLEQGRYQQLRRRALHTRLACEINLYYATSDSAVRDGRAVTRLCDAARELRDFHLEGPARDQRLTRVSQPAAAALLLWAHHTVCADLLCQANYQLVLSWLGRASGPTANYQAGCYFATAALDTTTRSTAAVTYLRRAVTDPDLADWITKDPQLKEVLGTSLIAATSATTLPTTCSRWLLSPR